MSNLQEIYNKLKIATQTTLENQVADKIKDTEHNRVINDVYSVYTPSMYQRKMDDYGLSDVRNMITKQYGEVGIEISNDTFHDKYVADVVETGDGYNYQFDYSGVPRPFQENTVEELKQTNEHVEVLKNELRNKGFNIE